MWTQIIKGDGMAEFIPYGKQDISQEDIDAVVAVLKSDFLTQGPEIPRFEKLVSQYCSAKFGVAVNSATSALHIACLALGVGRNDRVWTSPITFVASANCALYCGAQIDFVDIDPKTYNLSVEELKKKLEIAAIKNCLPKVVIPVHLCGQSCHMEPIYRLSKQYGFSIIEDASHAIGGKYKKRRVGSCEYSDITVFSFHPVKIVTTGEGGVALTNNKDLAEKMQLLRSHGITRDPLNMDKEPDGPWYYQQINLGYNYRMTDIQAALGASQMNRVDKFVEKRNHLAKRYDRLLEGLQVTTPWQHEDCYSSRHLYVILLSSRAGGGTHTTIFQKLRDQGIGVNLHYIPVHTQPYFSRFGFKKGQFPHAENYYSKAISLPLYPDLSEAQQERVVDTLKKAMVVS